MNRILKTTGICLIILIVAYAMLSIRPYKVSGDSMDSKLKNSTIILIDTFSPRLLGISRGDIVVYTLGDEIRIKRVLGLGGELITIKDGNIYSDSILIRETYLNPNLKTCAPGSCIDTSEKNYSVPQNSYFVLGDNRENSRDSRGCLDEISCDEKAIYYVEKSDIVGKYLFALPSFGE